VFGEITSGCVGTSGKGRPRRSISVVSEAAIIGARVERDADPPVCRPNARNEIDGRPGESRGGCVRR